MVAVDEFADSKCFSRTERGITAFAAAPAAAEVQGGDLGDGAICERFLLLACMAA